MNAALPRLALIYDASAPSPLDLSAALSSRFELIWVTALDDPRLGPLARLLPRTGTVVDTSAGLPNAVSQLASLAPAGVVAYCDDQLRTAGRIAELLTLPGNPNHVVDALLDKSRQRTVLQEAGLGVMHHTIPQGALAGDHADEVRAFGNRPLIWKPTRGESSRGVEWFEGPETLLRSWKLRGATTESTLIEEYLTGVAPAAGFGDYVSAEVAVSDGVPTVLAITGRFPIGDNFRESGNFMPHVLPADQAAAVITVAEQAVAALGVQLGVLHVEVKLHRDGPRIIEVNGRVGGGGIDRLFGLRHPSTLIQTAAALACSLPLESTPDGVGPHTGPFEFDFFLQAPGPARGVESITGLDTLESFPWVTQLVLQHGPGASIDPTAGSQAYILRVSGSAATVEELAAVSERTRATVQATFA